MVEQTKNQAHKGYVRRFYETPTTVTTDDYVFLFARQIVKKDAIVIIPIAETNPADIRVEVSYDEPEFEDGDLDQDSVTWRQYITDLRIDTTDVPDDNKVTIAQFNTGITAIRVSFKSTNSGSASNVTCYSRGYHIER